VISLALVAPLAIAADTLSNVEVSFGRGPWTAASCRSSRSAASSWLGACEYSHLDLGVSRRIIEPTAASAAVNARASAGIPFAISCW